MDYGVTRFLVGHYGTFDAMAAGAVIRAKQAHPDIELLLLLPYHPTERPVELMAGFDGRYYPEGMERVPRRLAIVRANEYVIRHACDYLIAYDRYIATKTHDFVELALQREKKGLIHVTNLATKFSASLPFVVYNSGSGTYRFTVQALGDGANYRNSAESEPSDTFTYVRPDAKLPTPQNLRWNRDVMLWDTVQDENVIGYYLRYDRRPAGSTDESAWRHCSDSSLFRADVGSCALRADERQAGYEYRFRVMAISRDITASCSSDFSDYSMST